MLEILVVMAVVCIMMAKHGRKGRRYLAVPFSVNLALGTLAAAAVIKIDLLGANFLNRAWLMSSTASWAIDGLTAGEGPIEVGYNHGDLDVTEIAECLDAEVVDPSNIIARERASRPVRRVGIFAGVGVDENLWNGMERKRKLSFPVNSGHAVQVWARNRTESSLTTGGRVRVQGTLYLRWL